MNPDDQIETLELPASRAKLLRDLAEDLATGVRIGRYLRRWAIAVGWALGGAGAAATLLHYWYGGIR